MSNLSTRRKYVARRILVPAIVIGLVVIGCALVDSRYIMLPLSIGGSILGLTTITLYQLSALQPDVNLSDVQAWRYIHTEEAARMVQDLLSPYPRYAAAAAVELGNTRDAAAVPSLVNVLDRSAWRAEPGWDEVCEAIVQALGTIGDGRALPVLNRVRAARGDDFRREVDAAVAGITGLASPSAGPISVRPPESLNSTLVIAGGEQSAQHQSTQRKQLVRLGAPEDDLT